MWLFTKDYFCSVVEDKEAEAFLFVRFRSRKHAEAFCHKNDMNVAIIREDIKRDYQFRISMPKSAFAYIAFKEANNINYHSFKGTTVEDKNYHASCYQVWGDMFFYQEKEGTK